MLLSSASRDCARILAEVGTCQRLLADVMRDVLRLVDVDRLLNCNGRSTIAHWQADDLLKRAGS